MTVYKSKYKINEELDSKKISGELENIAKFINTNVQKIEKEERIADNFGRRIFYDAIGRSDESPINPRPPGGGGVPDKPKYDPSYLGSIVSIEEKIESNLYPKISIRKRILNTDVGSIILAGTAPTGFTLRRIYWKVIGFANTDNLVEVKVGDDIVIFEGDVDLTSDNIGDKPMDYDITERKEFFVELKGTASATGEIRMTFELEKVYES